MSRRPIISFATSKGGSGKTTCLIALAGVLADQGGRVAIIDADPAQTVSRWGKRDGIPANITIYSVHDEHMLDDAIDRAARRSHTVLIDLEGRSSSILDRAIERSSLVVVPVQPSEPDGYEAARTIRAIRVAGNAKGMSIKFAVVMNRMPGAIVSRTYREIQHVFQQADIPMVAHLVDREAYRRMLMVGGTLFTLNDRQAPNLAKARNEAFLFGEKIGRMVGLIQGGGGSEASSDAADRASQAFKQAAEALNRAAETAALKRPEPQEVYLEDLAAEELVELAEMEWRPIDERGVN